MARALRHTGASAGSRLAPQVSRKAASAAEWSSVVQPFRVLSGRTRALAGSASAGRSRAGGGDRWGAGRGGAGSGLDEGLVAQAVRLSAISAAPTIPSRMERLRLRGVDVDQHPVGVAALQVALEGPELGGAPVLDPFAFRALGAAAEFSQEAHRQAGEVGAHHLGLLQVGAGR